MQNVVVIGGGLCTLHAVQNSKKLKGLKITAIMGNPFLEWTLGACHFVVRADRHEEFICPNPDTFKVPNVDYVFDPAVEVDTTEKTVKCANGANVAYDFLIVASGHKLPLIAAAPGHTVESRMKEVKEAAQAIKNAKTVVINGAGAVGLELAGDVRATYPDKRVVVLSRDGRVIPAQPQAWADDINKQLKKMNIEVIKGSIDRSLTDYKLTPGTLAVSNGDVEKLEYDVYFPCFQQGPNTSFLAGAGSVLNEKGQISVNEFLQSKASPHIFAVGVSDGPYSSGSIAVHCKEQAATVAKNVLALAEGRPMTPHKASQGPDAQPINIKIGHGKGAHMRWNADGFPAPVKCCCCLWCKGGFPCCPPPCCWCLCPGCARCFGNCCGEPAGEGPAVWVLESANKKIFPKFNHFTGMGEKPKQQTMKTPADGQEVQC